MSVEGLREAATRAFEEGRFEEARARLLELEALDRDPETAKRVAQACHSLGDVAGEMAALGRAARGFADQGDILRAAVTCKLILAIDPDHEETRRMIPELVARRDAELKVPPRTEPPPPPTPEAAERIKAAVHDFYFREILPHQQPQAIALELAGVHRIKLRGEPSDDFELIVEDPVEVLGAPSKPPPADAPALAMDVLRSTLFAGLSPKTFGLLMEHAKLVELADGQELFHQGEIGDALYVVVSGTVGVIDEGPPRRGIAKLGERSIFGEIAVLTDQPRTATVLALGPVQLIVIDRQVVSTLTAHDPRFIDALLRFVRDRLVDRLLATNPLFVPLSSRDREALKQRFQLFEADVGAKLIEQDKLGKGLLILLAGHAEVLRSDDGSERKVGELHPGDVAGEIALVTGQLSTATVRCTKRSLLVSLPASVFHTIVRARPEAMSYVQRLVEQRLAASEAILSGKVSGKAPPAKPS